MTSQQPPLNEMLLQAARLWIAVHRPYYATALYRCPIVSSTITPTFAVDEHWRIYVNPNFANQLSVTRCAAILIHELNHLIRDHSSRAQAVTTDSARGHYFWNLAGDAEINDDLVEDGLDLDKAECIMPKDFDLPEGKVAEYYFSHLHIPHEFEGFASEHVESCDPACGSGSGGIPLIGELPAQSDEHLGVSSVEARLLRDQVAQEVLKHNRQHGDLPGTLVAWAEQIREPKVDWRRVLDGMIRHAVATVAGTSDYSYRRFSRRGQTTDGIRFPGMIRAQPNVAVVVDTSGSMSNASIATALGEVQGILRSASVAEDAVTVLTVDTQVAEVVTVTDARHVRRMGRGGTDMRVGIEAATSLKRRPHVIVVLTDGYTPWPEHPIPGVQVIVGIIDGPSSLDELDIPTWANALMIQCD